jgi:hypothetical protein
VSTRDEGLHLLVSQRTSPRPVLRSGPSSLCRYRAETGVVPAGAIVRHPRCPRCGKPLAYRPHRDVAWSLHADDPRFILSVVK